MNRGVKTVSTMERARARKQAVMGELEHTKMMLRSIQMLLGRTLERAKCKALTFDVDELEAFDPDRVTLVDMTQGYGKVIVYIKDSASDEVNLDFLSKRALKSVEAPAENDNDGPVAQLVEQEPLTLPVGGSNPSGLAEEPT
jgi:hypothetical protein